MAWHYTFNFEIIIIIITKYKITSKTVNNLQARYQPTALFYVKSIGLKISAAARVCQFLKNFDYSLVIVQIYFQIIHLYRCVARIITRGLVCHFSCHVRLLIFAFELPPYRITRTRCFVSGLLVSVTGRFIFIHGFSLMFAPKIFSSAKRFI